MTAVVARDRERAIVFAQRFGAVPLAIGEPIPPVDLVVIAVRDDAIESVADRIAPVAGSRAAVSPFGPPGSPRRFRWLAE